jgi:hypothetical protein
MRIELAWQERIRDFIDSGVRVFHLMAPHAPGDFFVSVLESTTPPFTAHDAHKKTSSGEFGLPLRFLPIRCPT